MPLFFVFLFLFIFCLAAYTTGVALLTLPARPIFRKIIIALGFFSPISFILANVWFRYYPNIFSQVFYTFSSYLGAYRDWETDRKSTRLNSSHLKLSRMPSSA